MIDLSTQSVAGKIANVSDIVYYETLKLLGVTKCTDHPFKEVGYFSAIAGLLVTQ